MNVRPSADRMERAVGAYCNAIAVPAFDEAAITAALPVRAGRAAPRRINVAARSVAVLAGLVLLACSMPAVVAAVQHAFAAFSIAGGRPRPMTIRAVDLERARADMPFAVIAPPAIAGFDVVAVDEIAANPAASDGSVVFQLHRRTPGPDVMIVESDAARHHAPTVLTIGRPPDAARFPAIRRPQVVLRGSFQGRTFAPASWVAHGTRIVVMSPPGLLSSEQLQTIRHRMSR
jgi:hypothetical protein